MVPTATANDRDANELVSSVQDGLDRSDDKDVRTSSGCQLPAPTVVLQETVAGVTVALAMIPEAIVFAVGAGLPPVIGIKTSFIMCTLTAILGGRPAMVSGATSSIAVLIPGLVQQNVTYLFYSVILMGLIQILFGFIGAGHLVRLVPAPVEAGFANGLALLIFLAQFKNFKLPESLVPADSVTHVEVPEAVPEAFQVFVDGVPFISGMPGFYAALVCIVSFGITILLPKLTARVPAAITGILCGTAFEWLIVRLAIKSSTILIGDLGTTGGHFPYPVWLEYDMPALNFEVFKTVFKTSFMMSVIGLLESVMTLNILNEITKSNGDILRECIGQGVSNIVTGAFGGMGGCAMLGQSIINVSSGARGRTSSFVAGISVLFVLLVAYHVVQYVPLAALAGVMYNVVIKTFEWHTLELIFFSPLPRSFKQRWFPSLVDRKIHRADVLVMVVVVVVALVADLFYAVIAGAVLACLLFVYDAAAIISVTSRNEGESKYYSVHGTLFFGSASNFLQLFDYQGDPHDVHVIFEGSYIVDFTAVESLNKLAERYHELGKHVTLHKAHSQKIVSKARNLLVQELTLAEDAEVAELRPSLSEASLPERSRGWAFLDGNGIPAAENVTDHDRDAENQAEHDTPERFV